VWSIKMLRAQSESLNGRVKARLAYSRLTWQGLVERLHSCVSCVLLGLRRGNSGCSLGETRAPVQHSVLCLESGREEGELAEAISVNGLGSYRWVQLGGLFEYLCVKRSFCGFLEAEKSVIDARLKPKINYLTCPRAP
jgi:hypothetical protein